MTGRILDIRKEGIRESLQSFEGVEHRLEFVQEVNGITFINDSKATNVNSVWYALECAQSPVIWIAGGIDKGNDYSTLVPLVRDKVKHLICMGKNNALQGVRRARGEQLGRQLGRGSRRQGGELGQNGDTRLAFTCMCQLRFVWQLRATWSHSKGRSAVVSPIGDVT